MKATFTTQGTCARQIEIEIEEDKIKEVRFVGGCRGNAAGISALLPGMSVQEVIRRLKGTVCRGKTSCPDQLAIALEQMSLLKAS